MKLDREIWLMNPNTVWLSKYVPGPDYTPGASLFKQLLWFCVGSPLVMSYWLPFSALKVSYSQNFRCFYWSASTN